MPDVPPEFRRCFRAGWKGGGTADETLINVTEAAEKRGACGERFVKWYEGVKAAQKK